MSTDEQITKEVIDIMRYNTNNADDVLDLISEKLDVSPITIPGLIEKHQGNSG